jgi:hypothetical protein
MPVKILIFLIAVVTLNLIFLRYAEQFIFMTSSSQEAEGSFLVQKQIMSLLSPAAFCFGIDTVLMFEDNGVGATWEHLDSTSSGAFTLKFCIHIMCADCVLYMLTGMMLAVLLFPENQSWKCRAPSFSACRRGKQGEKYTVATETPNTAASSFIIFLRTTAVGCVAAMFQQFRKGDSFSNSSSMPFLPLSFSDEDFGHHQNGMIIHPAIFCKY